MTPQEAAEEFFRFYRGKHRVLLYFGPASYDKSTDGPFTTLRYRDIGDLRDVEGAPWDPRGGISFTDHMRGVRQASRAKGGVHYSEECRNVDLVGVMLTDPGVVRVYEKNDPRLSLETETGIRQYFGIGDDDFAMVLIGKDGREYARYKPPVVFDDVLAYAATLPDALV